MKQKDPLQAHLNDFLPEMDDALAKEGMPISERPMAAARFFVDHLVQDVSGGTKENYLLQPWFASIFRPIQDWYKKRYGEAKVHPKRALKGAIKHHDALYQINVPLTVARPQADGTCWLTFAKDVLAGEDPATWVTNGPQLDEMKPKQAAAFQEVATATAGSLRAIANDLKTADLDEGPDRNMANSVLQHLSKAASDMCALDDESSTLAVWELQCANEKVMKTYLTQERISYPNTHDLRNLNKLAPPKHDWSVVASALTGFPAEKRVMAWRYQEKAAPTVSELWRYYGVSLQVCAIYAARMSRQYVFNNFAVHLKRPPWLGLD